MQNRKQRRELEKKFGLYKKYKKAPLKERLLIQKRKIEMGKKLHMQYLENLENELRKAREEAEAKAIQALVAAGKSLKEAYKIIENNKRIKNK